MWDGKVNISSPDAITSVESLQFFFSSVLHSVRRRFRGENKVTFPDLVIKYFIGDILSMFQRMRSKFSSCFVFFTFKNIKGFISKIVNIVVFFLNQNRFNALFTFNCNNRSPYLSASTF